MGERRGDFEVATPLLSGRLADPEISQVLHRIVDIYGSYDVLEVTDLFGKVLFATSPEARFDPSREDWSALPRRASG